MSTDPLDVARRPGPVPSRLVGRMAGGAWRRRLLAAAAEDTDAAAGRRSLVVAARPGDEVLGCGATIARKRAAGTEVDLVIVTDGRHLRTSRVLTPGALAAQLASEAVEAAEMLGVSRSHVHFLGFEEATLARCPGPLAAALGKLLAQIEPDEVLVPAAQERDPERRAVHAAVCRAVDEAYPGVSVAAYFLDSWVRPRASLTSVSAPGGWSIGSVRADRFRAVRAERFRYLQMGALERYRSRLSNLTGELGWRVLDPGAVALLTGPVEVFEHVTPAQVSRHAATAAGRVPPRRSSRPARKVLVGGVVDNFVDDLAPGEVIGSRATSGASRLGVDTEGTLSVAGGRLRLDHLDEPGWGRQGIAYGPFARRTGLALVTRVVNAHHNAHTVGGPRTPRAVLSELRHEGPSRRLFRKAMADNLVVGFSPVDVPRSPDAAGNAFVVRAAGAVNGELRARVAGVPAALLLGLEELAVTYVVVLRERGATYYVSAAEGAPGLPPWPSMRPVAVDLTDDAPVVYAGIHQAVHAEGHYELASAAEEVRVGEAVELSSWHGGAAAADALSGYGSLTGSVAEVGGRWAAVSGSFVRGVAGAAAEGLAADARLVLGAPAGLVHVVLSTSATLSESTWAGLSWRGAAATSTSTGTNSAAGPGDGWRVRVRRDEAELAVSVGGVWETVATGPAHLPAAAEASLQVIDDGRTMSVLLDGRLLFDRWFTDDRHATGTVVGILSGPAEDTVLRGFEAHARQVRVPRELEVPAPWDRRGGPVVVEDRFGGGAGDLELVERPGAPAWARSLGPGLLELTGEGSLRVRADRHRPNPGRTVYTVPWGEPRFADLEVELIPPGTGRSQGQGSRGGLAFWQDDGNYLVLNVWLDDSPTHDGSAVSLFCCSGGREREAEALWANVGRAVTWGRPCTLRAASDGEHLMVRLDGEPVLYRRWSDVHPGAGPLRIQRVGLVVNREWGDDTGTTFTRFIARDVAVTP